MTRTNKKSNKKLLAWLASILAVATLIAGTFAWIQSKDSALNELSTRQITGGEVAIQEVFTPPGSWDPGMNVAKEVSMVNTGSGNALVRVSLEEILYLVNKNTTTGEFVEKTNTYSGAPIISGNADVEKDWIPVNVDISSYVDDSSTPVGINGWRILTSAEIDASKLTNTSALTGADVTVLMKKTTSPSNVDSYGYFAYRTVSAGVYQKVELGSNRVNTVVNTATGAFEKVELLGVSDTDKNIKFCWFGGRTRTEDTWAGTYNYVANTLSALKPAISLSGTPAITTNSPLDQAAMVALTGASASSMIKINFGTYMDGATQKAAVTTVLADAVAQGIWYYCQADGYFYYMGVLEAGSASKQLLGSLTMSGDAAVEHSLMDYKLGIVSDAIQNTSAAIGAAGASGVAWEIPATETALLTALHNLCEN